MINSFFSTPPHRKSRLRLSDTWFFLAVGGYGVGL